MERLYTPQFNFNPLPRKEGDAKFIANSPEKSNFNPLPRKEGDNSL